MCQLIIEVEVNDGVTKSGAVSYVKSGGGGDGNAPKRRRQGEKLIAHDGYRIISDVERWERRIMKI